MPAIELMSLRLIIGKVQINASVYHFEMIECPR